MTPDREIDALIDERVFGLKPCSDPTGRCDGAKTRPVQCWGDGGAGRETPSYSTDIAAAWTVIERLMELGCDDFRLEWERPKDFRPGWQRKQQPEERPWLYAMNAPRHLSGSKSIGMPDPVVLHAATMPLAICQAALWAVDVTAWPSSKANP
jgi:hypothetical protein